MDKCRGMFNFLRIQQCYTNTFKCKAEKLENGTNECDG